MVDQISYIESSHILKDLIQNQKYLPLIKEYPNDTENIILLDENIFSKKFPRFFKFINDLDNLFTEEIHKINSTFKIDLTLKNFVGKKVVLYDEEIKKFIGEKYITLRGQTKIHTINFLHMFYNFLINFTKEKKISLNDYDKNILYWTILFHDLGKFHCMNPNINENYNNCYQDKSHPFKSIILFFEIFLNKKLIYFESPSNKNSFIKNFEMFKYYIYKSFEKEYNHDTHEGFYNISFKNIEEIKKFFDFIKQNVQNKWIYDIATLIIFHQSLPNTEREMNKPLLDNKYIKIFFDIRLIELMRIIMVYDSASHSLFEGGNWIEEINKNLDEVINLFQ